MLRSFALCTHCEFVNRIWFGFECIYMFRNVVLWVSKGGYERVRRVSHGTSRFVDHKLVTIALVQSYISLTHLEVANWHQLWIMEWAVITLNKIQNQFICSISGSAVRICTVRFSFGSDLVGSDFIGSDFIGSDSVGFRRFGSVCPRPCLNPNECGIANSLPLARPKVPHTLDINSKPSWTW